MSEPVYKQYEWLVLALLYDAPRTYLDLVRSTGVDRNMLADAIWSLERAGKLRVRPDSVMEVVL